MRKILILIIVFLGMVSSIAAMDDKELMNINGSGNSEVVININDLEDSLNINNHETYINKQNSISEGLNGILKKFEIENVKINDGVRKDLLICLERNENVKKHFSNKKSLLGNSGSVSKSLIGGVLKVLLEQGNKYFESKEETKKNLETTNSKLGSKEDIIKAKDETIKAKEKDVKSKGLLAKLGITSAVISSVATGAIAGGVQYVLPYFFGSNCGATSVSSGNFTVT